MKSIYRFFVLGVAGLLLSAITPKQASAQEAEASFQVFYDQLSPYGQWIDNSRYGYIWIPDAGRDFVPYSTDGHWVMTDYGWTWVSDYQWGWAPFHYGRWDYDSYYGWFWVPDTVWGPAWVTWRRSEGYYGWAPMSPGISINISIGNRYRLPADRWVFVRDVDIERPNIHNYYIDRSRNTTIINNTTVINNTYIDRSRNVTYVSGPKRSEVQRVTGRTLNVVSVRESNRPGQNLNDRQLQIYRPRVESSTVSGSAPQRVARLRDVAPVEQRTYSTTRLQGNGDPTRYGRIVNRNTPSSRNLQNNNTGSGYNQTITRPVPQNNSLPVGTPDRRSVRTYQNNSSLNQNQYSAPAQIPSNNSSVNRRRSVPQDNQDPVYNTGPRTRVITPTQQSRPIQQQRSVRPQQVAPTPRVTTPSVKPSSSEPSRDTKVERRRE